MLFIVGAVFLLLGLLSGGVLVAAGVGVASLSAGLVLWAAFPLLLLIGYAMLVAQASLAQIRAVSLAASGTLLLLAVASVVALILQSASVLHAVANAMPLWYVFVIGGVLGGLGAATSNRQWDKT